MKKLLLLLSLVLQVVVGADKQATNVVQQILEFTEQQYRELESFEDDEMASGIIWKATGKAPREFACQGYIFLKNIIHQFNKGKMTDIELYNTTESIIENIDTLITTIHRMKKIELEEVRAAKEIEILYQLAKNKHAASIIEVKEGMNVQKIAEASFVRLAEVADWYEMGMVSDSMVCHVVKFLIDNTHRIVNSVQDEAPYLFEKGKYGRRKSI